MSDGPSRRRFLTGLGVAAFGSRPSEPTARPIFATPLRFAHAEDSRPWSWRGDDGLPYGLTIDIVDLLSRVSGVSVSHEILPSARAFRSLGDGEADGVITVASEERARDIKFGAVALIETETRFYFRRDNPRARDIAMIRAVADLKRFKVTDTLAGPWTSVNAAKLMLDQVPNQSIAYRMVLMGRSDVAIINRHAAHMIMGTSGSAAELEWIPAPINPHMQYRVGLRRGLPGCDALLARFDEAARKPDMRVALETVTTRYL